MAAVFELKSNDEGFFYFHYTNDSKELVLMSAEYEDKSEAEQDIKDVKTGSLMSEQIAAGKTPDGSNFFLIKNAAGEVLVKSVLYNDDMEFNNALHQVKDNACVAEIVDLTA